MSPAPQQNLTRHPHPTLSLDVPMMPTDFAEGTCNSAYHPEYSIHDFRGSLLIQPRFEIDVARSSLQAKARIAATDDMLRHTSRCTSNCRQTSNRTFRTSVP